jgi:hypothetical protein
MAGVSEDGEWSETMVVTPQGAVISPLLANVYLHYVFDLWAEVWQKIACGEVIIVRCADDLVAGFQHQADAERFLRDFQERLAKFGLEIHPEKTRLIEFGRFAASDRRKRGQGKPETFTFLGFTHYCGRNSKGHFVVWRRTAAKRLRAKLLAIKQELRRKMHELIVLVGAWLKRVVEGYFRYHAVPGNLAELGRFRERLCRYWRRILRSQRRKPPWETTETDLRPVASSPANSTSLSRRALRSYPREEPYAVIPLVRICAGGDQRWLSLPRPMPRDSLVGSSRR